MLKLGTHDGCFHADDVMAAAILGKYLHQHYSLVRTRDTTILDSCDIVFDVGSKYSKGTHYDHHQLGGAGFRDNGIPYAAAGLVWREYGPKLCRNQAVVDRVDSELIQTIDAIDNGYWEMNEPTMYNISRTLSSFNPTWDSDATYDLRFKTATVWATDVLYHAIQHATGWVKAQKEVVKAFNQDPMSRILILDKYVPYTEHLLNLQVDFYKGITLYCVHPSPTNTWIVKCIPPTLGSFQQRRPLPKEWAGLRDTELQTVTGVQDTIFCHNNRFMCVAKTKVGALELAYLALANETN